MFIICAILELIEFNLIEAFYLLHTDIISIFFLFIQFNGFIFFHFPPFQKNLCFESDRSQMASTIGVKDKFRHSSRSLLRRGTAALILFDPTKDNSVPTDCDL